LSRHNSGSNWGKAFMSVSTTGCSSSSSSSSSGGGSSGGSSVIGGGLTARSPPRGTPSRGQSVVDSTAGSESTTRRTATLTSDTEPTAAVGAAASGDSLLSGASLSLLAHPESLTVLVEPLVCVPAPVGDVESLHMSATVSRSSSSSSNSGRSQTVGPVTPSIARPSPTAMTVSIAPVTSVADTRRVTAGVVGSGVSGVEIGRVSGSAGVSVSAFSTPRGSPPTSVSAVGVCDHADSGSGSGSGLRASALALQAAASVCAPPTPPLPMTSESTVDASNRYSGSGGGGAVSPPCDSVTSSAASSPVPEYERLFGDMTVVIVEGELHDVAVCSSLACVCLLDAVCPFVTMAVHEWRGCGVFPRSV
jgi:hypothetical protein